MKAAKTVLAAKVANPTAENPTETLILSQPIALFQNPIFFGPLHAPWWPPAWTAPKINVANKKAVVRVSRMRVTFLLYGAIMWKRSTRKVKMD